MEKKLWETLRQKSSEFSTATTADSKNQKPNQKNKTKDTFLSREP
jgi:hypothetical protein